MSFFKETLKQELSFRDIRVKELAQMSGVSKRTIDHYLAEKSSEPMAEAAVKIARALGVSTEYLVTGSGQVFQKEFKPEVFTLLQDLNKLSLEDLKLFSSLLQRFNLKTTNRK